MKSEKWALIRSMNVWGLSAQFRFIQQTETGWGDYTAERENWLGNPDISALFDAIKAAEKK